MFVPVYDENPIRTIKLQYVTLGLILINAAVFFLFQLRDVMNVDPCGALAFAKNFGIVPTELRGTQVVITECPNGAASALPFPEPLTLLSYMFLHGDIWHLLGNMVFLWVFGDNVEDAMGHVRFLVFFILCGLAGGLLHSVVFLDSPLPLIGASAAVAGVIAAYLMLHPRVSVWVLAFRVIPLKLSAALVLGLWIIMNVVAAFFPTNDELQQVAWFAHIGGMVAGAILVVLLRRPGVPLFGNVSTPAKT